MHRSSLFVRRRVAVRAHPRALEAVGTAADRRVPCVVANARVGSSRTLALHLRRAAVVLANAGAHRANGLGVHDGTSAFASVMMMTIADGLISGLTR